MKKSPEYSFEAAWTAKGVYCVSRFRYPDLLPPEFSLLKHCDTPEDAAKLAATEMPGVTLLYNASCSPADACMVNP